MSKRTRSATKLVIVVTIALLIAWDIFVAAEPQDGDTISELVLGFALKHPVIPFAFGVLMGHFFWPQEKSKITKHMEKDEAVGS